MSWKLFGKKELPNREPSDTPIQPEVFYLNSGIGVAVVKWDNVIAAQAAMRHPIVYRALDKLSSSVQQMRWQVVEDPNATATERNTNKGRAKHLQQVLDSPNGEMTPAMFRYWMTLNYASYGRVAMQFSYSAVDTDRISGVYPLESRYTFVQLNNRGVANKYTYGMGEAEQKFPSFASHKVGNSFIEQIWKPGLRGFIHHEDGNSPLASIGLPAQVMTSLLKRAIQTAEGHPNVRYMVTCSRTLTNDQKSALKSYLNEDHGPGGPESGKIPILQNAADIEIHKLDNDLSDIHSKTPSDDMARLIFGAFGIPISIAGIGAADAAKFAGNFNGSRVSFWEDTIIPMYVQPLFQGLTRIMAPPGLLIAPDYDSVPALVSGRTMAMKDMASVDFLTINEKRDVFGFAETEELKDVKNVQKPVEKDPMDEGTPAA